MGRRYGNVYSWREGIGFWLIVLLICMVAGVISYQAGKNWVGRHLAQINLKASQRELPPEGIDDDAVADLPESARPEAPLTTAVTVEEREPSEAERAEVEHARLEREQIDEPQDGAQLNRQSEEAKPASEARESGYVVTAGSYADRDNAQKVIQRLTEKGYRPFATEMEKHGIVFRRVNVAVFEDRAQAERLRDELKEQGFVSGVMPQ